MIDFILLFFFIFFFYFEETQTTTTSKLNRFLPSIQHSGIVEQQPNKKPKNKKKNKNLEKRKQLFWHSMQVQLWWHIKSCLPSFNSNYTAKAKMEIFSIWKQKLTCCNIHTHTRTPYIHTNNNKNKIKKYSKEIQKKKQRKWCQILWTMSFGCSHGSCKTHRRHQHYSQTFTLIHNTCTHTYIHMLTKDVLLHLPLL